VYKFVIFNDGTILFCNVDTRHDTLAAFGMREFQARKPVGAGKIKYSNKKYQIEDRGSFTLGIKGLSEEDHALLDEALHAFGISLSHEYLY
jgi:hypothetical protein